MAFTQTDLDAINRAIASGELTVRYADTTVTYRSLSELVQARDIITGEIAAASGGTPTPTYSLAATSKG